MERYKNVQIEKDSNNKKNYASSIPPTIVKDERDIYFYSVWGDRLDNIAFEYYGDVTLWPVIATANNLGKGTLYPPVGTQIRIPYQEDNQTFQRKWLETDLDR